ncbi:DUF6470 family protein [Paenibacillus abyssi]|uniref:Uncharacterized protein n=1 Tax=Paenibacillus abyssi TaxID=1340531 RepID=A0A917CKC6_9BACL|nr:DUF6470 family protein [Paenibacillus abyssi]GGF91517.1 hypothetical protein GCM10010916_06020 [Paenibacillus abyssi]
MAIPQIQIHQDYAKLGINADLGTQIIKQPRATFEMRTSRPELQINQPQGNLEVNQDRAWDALGLGNNLVMMSRIYSRSPDIALRGLARIVEDGNRMAQIHLGGNPFAELAKDWRRTFPDFDVRGPASYDNVDVKYTQGDLSIRANSGRVELHTAVNPPVHDYARGRLDLYMLQRNKVEITPPQIDAAV